METKYVIVRLDDNQYWGFGFWQGHIDNVQLFDNKAFPTRRIYDKDLVESDATEMTGKYFEVREIFVIKKKN